jgi:hypothetical protein
MAILMPELTVEVYNADYRVLSRIPWQEAIRLIPAGCGLCHRRAQPRCAHTQPVAGGRAADVSGAARVRAYPVQGG